MQNFREVVGMISSLGAVAATFVALPLVPPEAEVVTATVAVGLWAVGIVSLAPYLQQPTQPQRNLSQTVKY